MDNKISIRFYKNREVRAVWDGEGNKWWFSVLDVIGVMNEQDDYAKNRNYWKYLKTKLKKEGNELVSITNQLKLQASDGKYYLSDVLTEMVFCFWPKTSPTTKRPSSWIGSPTATPPLTDKVAKKPMRCLKAASSTLSKWGA